ncbi:tetratricopeptide (TPR) repeat protein [Thermococcus stetteri]|nr:hypothetical protein [Thermococcus stetteri]MBP1910750.1 tetratricopeptide (TPR) repeat protein [Thermococcus stetteri]
MDLLGSTPPEEIEEIGFKYVESGKIKEGLKLILRAAQKYEEKGNYEDAARLFRYIGSYLAKKASSEKARPYLLKAASLYIRLVEEEISKPDVDLDALDQYTLSVLEVFATTGDSQFLTKYGIKFASIYEELGSSFENMYDLKAALRVYESAFHYYKIANSIEDAKRIANKLVDVYSKLTEELIENKQFEEAGDAFWNLAKYIRILFGHDEHYIEMMDTAASNYERASKMAYSEGDLDRTTSNLVKAQYAYLLAENSGRAKLVGINAIRMLNQVIGTYRTAGDDKNTARKLMELTKALLGIGKYEEAINSYKEVINLDSGILYKIDIRHSLLQVYIAENGVYDLLDIVEIVDFYVSRKRPAHAYELLIKVLESTEMLSKINRKILEAEGYY